MYARKKRDVEAPAGERVGVSKHAARDALRSHVHFIPLPSIRNEMVPLA